MSNNSEIEVKPDIEEVKSKYSRRQFLKISIIIAIAALVWKETIWTAKKVLRPPGALKETDFNSVCNRCGKCIKVCPNNALHPMPVTEGLGCFETPYIIPRQANCTLCLACQDVCPTGAIVKVPMERINMGKAAIDEHRCLAWNKNKLCFICGEQCPNLAIEGDIQHRPKVRKDKCVGCGTCENACPVHGKAAIRVRPS